MIKRFKQMERKSCSLSTRSGTIAFFLTRSSRRRTMEISVNDSMEVRVATPLYALEREIHRFIQDKADWIIEKLKETQQLRKSIQRREYTNGHQFLFLGKKYKLEVVEAGIRKARISFDGVKWTVKIPPMDPGDDPQPLIKKKLIQWYRIQAKEIFGGRVLCYARDMGLKPQKILVKTQKRIWGSCNHLGKTINLNWHLVLSPLNVIDYVIVHELCHLQVPSHSKRFWDKVKEVIADYRQCQRWLKTNALDMTLP